MKNQRSEELLDMLPLGPAGKGAIKEWMNEFGLREVKRPILVLIAEPGLRGSLQAFARALADETGSAAELYYEEAALEESTTLAGGGEIAVIDGYSSLLASAEARGEVERTLRMAVEQSEGPRYVILVSGPNLMLPSEAVPAALQVSMEMPAAVS